MRKLRLWLLAGIVVLAPVWLTLLTVTWLFSSLDEAVSGPLIRYFNMPLPGVGVLLALVVTMLVGWLTTHFLGQKLVDLGERLMMRIPIVRPIYSALKQVAEAVLSPKDRAFSRVALIEYPRAEVYSLGFVAGEMVDLGLVRLWIANGPSPSAGPVVIVPLSQVVMLPMTVEDGLKLVISAGVLSPKAVDMDAVAGAIAALRQRREIPVGGGSAD